MNTSETIFRQQLIPKIILIIFLVIAYELLKLFPFINEIIFGKFVIDWLHLFLVILIIGILFGSLSGLKEFISSILNDIMKEKVRDWSDAKKKSMDYFITNSLILIIIVVSYQIISKDLTIFLGDTLFDTLLRIGILLTGLYFIYKAYKDLNIFLNQK